MSTSPRHRRQGSWSSDLVMCDGASDVNIDWLAAAAATREQYGLGNAYVQDPPENDSNLHFAEHEEKQAEKGDTFATEADDDDDEFDFRHLLGEFDAEENEMESDSYHEYEDGIQIDNSAFEPYHDAETNRMIMRMRMGNLMDYVSTTVTSDSEDEELLDQSMEYQTTENGFTPFEQSFLHMRQSPDMDQQEPVFDQVSFTDPYNAWSEASNHAPRKQQEFVECDSTTQLSAEKLSLFNQNFAIPEVASFNEDGDENELPSWCSPPSARQQISHDAESKESSYEPNIHPNLSTQQFLQDAESKEPGYEPDSQFNKLGDSSNLTISSEQPTEHTKDVDCNTMRNLKDSEIIPGESLCIDNDRGNEVSGKGSQIPSTSTEAKENLTKSDNSISPKKNVRDLLEGTDTDQQIATDFNSNTMQDEVEFLLQNLQIGPETPSFDSSVPFESKGNEKQSPSRSGFSAKSPDRSCTKPLQELQTSYSSISNQNTESYQQADECHSVIPENTINAQHNEQCAREDDRIHIVTPNEEEKRTHGRPRYTDWLARNKEWTKKRIRRNRMHASKEQEKATMQNSTMGIAIVSEKDYISETDTSNKQMKSLLTECNTGGALNEEDDKPIIQPGTEDKKCNESKSIPLVSNDGDNHGPAPSLCLSSSVSESTIPEPAGTKCNTGGALNEEDDKNIIQHETGDKKCNESKSIPLVSIDRDKHDAAPSLCLSCSISDSTVPEPVVIPEKSIDEQFALFVDMLQNQKKPIEEIKDLMRKCSNLSSREVTAFWIGFQSHNTEKEAPHNTPNPVQSPSDTEKEKLKNRLIPSTSVQTSRLQDRSLSKTSQFDENLSKLMSTVKMGNTTNNDRDRWNEAQTSISVMSTMSCRDLSIQRLKRRIALSKSKEQNNVQQLLKDLQDAQERQTRLEKQLNQAGITIAEDISYDKAKAEVARISQEMQSIGSSQATHSDPKEQARMRQEYFVLEQQMEKYMRALELTDEYLEEQERMERAFDEDNAHDNQIALQRVWKHMPADVRQRSVQDWLETPTPNGKRLAKPFLVKFSRTNILTLLRMKPEFIERAHPCNLEQRRVTGLTLTERRALHAVLQPIAGKWRNAKDPMTKRKWAWYCILRQTFKDHLLTYQQHVAKYGVDQDGCCRCSTLRCPVKANQKLNYFMEDYGHPCDLHNPEYETASGEQPARCKPVESERGETTNKEEKPARSTLLAEISSRGQNKSMMEELKSRASKNNISEEGSARKAKPKSLMDELKARANKKAASPTNPGRCSTDTMKAKPKSLMDELKARANKKVDSQTNTGKSSSPMKTKPQSLMDEMRTRANKKVVSQTNGESATMKAKPKSLMDELKTRANGDNTSANVKPSHGNLMDEIKGRANSRKG